MCDLRASLRWVEPEADDRSRVDGKECDLGLRTEGNYVGAPRQEIHFDPIIHAVMEYARLEICVRKLPVDFAKFDCERPQLLRGRRHEAALDVWLGGRDQDVLNHFTPERPLRDQRMQRLACLWDTSKSLRGRCGYGP